jgi:predicted glycosyltransferase
VAPAAVENAPPPAPSPEGCAVRALFYSHDGFGLGHLQRNFKIACHLVETIAGAQALLVTGSPHGFVDCRMPRGVDWLKIPSVMRSGSGRWTPRTLGVGRERMRELRSGAIRSAVETFRPQLLIIDHLPVGVWGELLPTLELCHRLPDPPRIVLGLRDILDRPEVTRRLWLREGAYEAIERYYDRVLVYGDRDLSATAEIGLEDLMPGRLAYCGYVGPTVAGGAARQMRRALALAAGEALVVVCGGGGGDSYALMSAAAPALACLAERRSLRGILVTGPLMGERRRQLLRRRLAGRPVEVLRQVEDLPALLGAADLVISMAGYNTMAEALAQRRRLMVAPRSGPSAEQTMRAAAFARRGLVTVVHPGEMSPSDLADLVDRHLQQPPPPLAGRPRMNGLQEVVRELRDLLSGDVAANVEVAASGPRQAANPSSA